MPVVAFAVESRCLLDVAWDAPSGMCAGLFWHESSARSAAECKAGGVGAIGLAWAWSVDPR